MQPLVRVPEPGFYYHYKHDPNGPVNNYAYYIGAIGMYTEKEGVFFANYQPLYETASVYQLGLKLGITVLDNRPLEMWMSDVEVDGRTIKRFTKITDPTVVAQLTAVKERMYPV